MIAAISISVLGYMYITEKGFFDNSIKLYAYLDEPTGISTKSNVHVNGYEIGKVNEIEIINNEIILELLINKKITLKNEAQLFSTPRGIMGDKDIEVQNSNQGQEIYSSGDTIKNKIISKSLKETLDPNKQYEPQLKEISKTIGTTLLEYANSPNEKCNESQLKFVLNRIENYPDGLNEKDAYILVENMCKQNAENAQLQNELTYRLLEINPTPIVNILENNNFDELIIEEFHSRIESPIHDGFNLTMILDKLKNCEQSIGKERLLNSLQIAIEKY